MLNKEMNKQLHVDFNSRNLDTLKILVKKVEVSHDPNRVKQHGSTASLAQLLVEALRDLVDEVAGVEVVGPLDVGHAALDAQRQVLGHEAGLDGVDAGGLEGGRELGQGGVGVQLGPVLEAARPREDGRDWVRARLAARLVLTVVPASKGSLAKA